MTLNFNLVRGPTMFNADQLDQVEISIKQAKEKISYMKSLEKLAKNKDFKNLIDTGYLEKEAIRLVHLKADLNMASEDNQKYINDAINAVGFFRNYLSTVSQQGEHAKQALVSHEETREEILSDDLIGEQ